ncbi:MAG: hypothetical protein JWM40_2942 [Frankiales bacterium]|nr:hypothetical protein [Frankiales bacterium]
MSSSDPLLLPLGQLPGPDDGIGDAERGRRLATVLDDIEDELAAADAAAALRSTA